MTSNRKMNFIIAHCMIESNKTSLPSLLITRFISNASHAYSFMLKNVWNWNNFRILDYFYIGSKFYIYFLTFGIKTLKARFN